MSSLNYQYQAGGSLAIDNAAYVERQADRDLRDRLREGEYCFVFNSRQMGKSSLRVRTMQRLQQEGFACAVIDPQTQGTMLREDQWYAGIIRGLFQNFQLDTTIDFKRWWKDLDAQSISPIGRFYEFIDRVLLPNIPQRIVIFIEEIDTLLSLTTFDSDGLFLLVRSFFEQRAEKPEYKRLTFAFFGVATPSDLIKNKSRSSFNVGHAIEMSGFQLHEAEPLVRGLEGKVGDPHGVLVAVLDWTGGQPFLTQKILTLISAEEGLGQASPEEMVRALVTEKIIENWETQDNPVHLKTIRDRILLSDEKGKGRLLGMYQQILDALRLRSATDLNADRRSLSGVEVSEVEVSEVEASEQEHLDGIAADESYDQMLLRLTGLVVRRDGRLMVYNPIYRTVFDGVWVSRMLADMRPEFYASALRFWKEMEEGQRDSFLLRGQALQDVEDWAKGKRLSDEDELFLRESREVERLEGEIKFEAERQAREAAEEVSETLDRANKIAKQRIRVGSMILVGTLVAAFLVIVGAKASVDDSNRKVADANKLIDNANLQKIDAERVASDASKQAKDSEEKRKNAATELNKAKVETVKAKTEKEKADAEVQRARGELAKLAEDAKAELASAEAELLRAEEARQRATMQVALAGMTLESTNSKIAYLDGRGLEATLLALRAGYKLKQIVLPDGIKRPLEVLSSLQLTINGLQELNRLDGHLSWVNSANFSPDGSKMLTNSGEGMARLWDIKGNLIYQFQEYKASFSSDGSKIITTSWEGTAKIWDIKGNLITELKDNQGKIDRITLSNDGNKILTNSNDGTVRLWNNKGTLITELKVEKYPSSIIFSPDSSRIVTTTSKSAQVWDTDGNLINEILGSFGKVSFSPDSLRIATVVAYNDYNYWNNFAKVWDIKGNLIAELKGYKVTSAHFSPDGSKILTTSYSSLNDQDAQIWDIKGNLINELKGHQGRVNSAMFSPDGSKIATASEDKIARIWDINGNLVNEFNGHQDAVNSASFSPDGRKIITASKDKTARVWDLSGNLITELNDKYFLDATFNSDSSKIVTVVSFSRGSEGEIKKSFLRVLNVRGNIITEVTAEGHQSDFLNAIFSPDKSKILTTSSDNIMRVWDLKGNLINQFQIGIDQKDRVGNASFSFDGSKIIITSWSGIAQIWDINGNLIANLDGHQNNILSASFSSDNSKILTTSYDTAQLWNTQGNLITKIKGHLGGFSPDGSKIATVNSYSDFEGDNILRVWDIKGNLIAKSKKQLSPFSSVSFSSDGGAIITSSSDNTTKLWNTNADVITEMKGIESRFSPNGNKIITRSDDKTARVWDVNGNLIALLIGHQNNIKSASFSPDGSKIMTVSRDTVRVWGETESDFDRLLILGCEKLNDYLTTNPNATNEDRAMCGISSRKKV